MGLTVAAHGAQKLFGIFGGHGLSGTSQFVESLGFRPRRLFAYALGLGELAGGALLAAGLFTPVATLSILAIMTAATSAVHWRKGFFASSGGFEYPLVIGAVAPAIAFTGPGIFSVDALLNLSWYRTAIALGDVVVGILAGLAVVGTRNLPMKDSVP